MLTAGQKTNVLDYKALMPLAGISPRPSATHPQIALGVFLLSWVVVHRAATTRRCIRPRLGGSWALVESGVRSLLG
jgi:hypothetical protein